MAPRTAHPRVGSALGWFTWGQCSAVSGCAAHYHKLEHGGKGLVGGLKGVVVEAICLRLKGVGKWLQVERADVRVGLRAAVRAWWAD